MAEGDAVPPQPDGSSASTPESNSEKAPEDAFDLGNAAFDSVTPAAASDAAASPPIDDAALQELLKLAEMEGVKSAADVVASPAFGNESGSMPDGDFLSHAGAAVDAANFDLPNFQQVIADAAASSIDLLRDVELNVKIELGRARMVVEDVLKLAEGSVVELDKLAGDPVDVFVNDRLVARGEVLVLNDNFCVRVNEIVTTNREDALA